MHSVMIVDDEVAIREKLPQLIDFAALGFRVCATAKNGAEAMALLQACKPDLIFLDVRMPVMDGIEFLKQLRQGEYHATRVVILSGYSDFEYAQKAMAYGVMAYLTKPVDEDEAVAFLKETAQVLDAEEQRRRRSAYLADLALLRTAYMQNSPIAFAKPYFILSMVPYKIRPQTHKIKPYPQISATLSHLTGMGEGGLFHQEGYVYSCLIPLSGEAGTEQAPVEFVQRLDALLMAEDIQCAFLLDTTVLDGAAPFHTAVLANLGRMLKEHFYNNQKQWACSALPAEDAPPDEDFLDDLYAGLRHHFPLLEDEAVMDTMHRLFERVREERPGIEALKRITDRLYHIFTGFVMMPDCQCEGQPSIPIPVWTRSPISCSFEIWKQQLAKQAADTLELLHQNKEQMGKGGAEVLDYVRRHYRQPLSIKQLAQQFNMNPAYLGRIFQKLAGKSLKQYVNQLRINEAKRLLLNTDKMIYEIAAEVGFSESSYFIVCFTKQEGVSPMEYRKR